MPTGTIKFFSAPKGFGFITPDEGGKDIFLPLLSLTAAGLTSMPLGQRVSFEIQPDKKGPKAISLAVIASAPAPRPAKSPVMSMEGQGATGRLTLYCDSSSEDAGIVLAALRAMGLEHSLVDYMASPPSRDKLIGISLLLRESDQSLMRKHDPLFRELQLDDRFISQNELWDAIVEHPSLINGPVLVNAGRARVCRCEEDVAAFLENRVARKMADRIAPRPVLQADVMVQVQKIPEPSPSTAEGNLQKPMARKARPVASATKAKMPAKSTRAKPKAAPKVKPGTASKAKTKTVVKAKPSAAKKSKT